MTVYDEAIKLIEKYGDKICRCKDMQDLMCELYPTILKEVLSMTKMEYYDLCYIQLPPSYTERQEVAVAADYLLTVARTSHTRWLIARLFQQMTDEIVRKICQIKQPNSYITALELWDDPSMLKSRRMGFYFWAEIITFELGDKK
jgi:hypothetical protein